MKHLSHGKPHPLSAANVAEAVGRARKAYAEQPPASLTAAEEREYDLCRLLRHAIAPETEPAKLERDVSGRLHIASPPASFECDDWFRVPWEPLGLGLAARDLVVGTPAHGGHLVATDLAPEPVEHRRNAARVIEAGATVLTGLRGNQAIPRQTDGATFAWVPENTPGSESQPAFDQIVMSPKTCTGFVDYSRRLLLQTAYSRAAQQIVARDLRDGIAAAIDNAALNGTGASNQPRGLLNTAGLGSVAGGANGAVPTYEHLVELEAAVAHANTLEQRMAFMTNTRVRARLQRSQVFGTNGVPIWQRSDAGDDRLNGRPAFVSNNVPHTLTKGTSVGVCSAIFYGNWPDLVLGFWGDGVSLLVDPYTGGVAGTVRVVCLVDLDLAVRHATSFAAMLDALTT